MPIARCLVTHLPDADLVTAWSRHAGVGPEHMTLQLVRVDAQQGRPYDAIAWLSLPTVWSDEAVDRLQLGLARALAEGLDAAPDRVMVMTSMIASGRVVEGGEIVHFE
ncbi:MAG: hypothetical protein VYE22_17285 [Myxococcota bacterium]|nr:hypothetical protein [Myxococcota bacterium]